MNNSLVDDYVNSNEITKNKNVMPQNLEAEQSLIGSILFDNKILEDLPTNFSSNYFFDPLHSSIYDASIALIDNGRLADPLTLKNYLSEKLFFYVQVIKNWLRNCFYQNRVRIIKNNVSKRKKK